MCPSSMTYYWLSVPATTQYELWLFGPAGLVFHGFVTPAEASCTGGGLCSLVLGTNLTPGDYEWWMRSTDGTYTSYHVPLNFTVQ